MHMLGIELRDSTALAIAIDEVGVVRARAERPLAGDPAAAAMAAVGEVNTASSGRTLGVAAADLEGGIAGAVLASLKNRYSAALVCGLAAPGTAAAVAEAWVGAARGVRDVVYLALADHTSAGIVRAGEPVVGAHGRATSVAWFNLNPVEREDYRNTGCLEVEVAASGIVRRLIWRIKSGDASRIQEVVNGDLTAITLDHVLDGARQKDGLSISVMRDTAKYVGMAAANLVIVADPEILVLGGIIASAPDVLYDFVRTEIGRRLPGPMMKALTIVPAALGQDAAAIGAARLAAVARR
jgi:predicted NBD/HSP70 family sugar kinase